MNNDLRVCSKCHQQKPPENFSLQKSGKGGRRSQCKACHREYVQTYRQQNDETLKQRRKDAYLSDPELREKVKQRARAWNRQNPERVQANQMRCRERSQGVIPDYTSADWVAVCQRFGYRCVRCGQRKPLTIDHVIPRALGGTATRDNLQPLCLECNSSKGSRLVDFRGTFLSYPEEQGGSGI